MGKIKNTILFNPMNTVQERNVGDIMRLLPGCRSRSIFDPCVPWFSGKKRTHSEHEAVFTGGRFAKVPGNVFDNVCAVVLFNAQPRVKAMVLREEALNRGIPVIAIEEVHQMLLEQGRVNNYFLPVDHILVASGYEKECFEKLGYDSSSVHATGYVIDAAKPKKISQEEKADIKKIFGLSPEKKTAVLSLAYLAPDIETLDVRKELITCAAMSREKGYELIIKPHPAESASDFQAFAKSIAPDCRIAETKAPIGQILSVADVLFNRGASQVVIDAIERDVPVIVVPCGNRTLFDKGGESVIVRNSSSVVKALLAVERYGMELYRDIFAKYLNISRSDAMLNASRVIDRIIKEGYGKDTALNFSELSVFWAFAGHRAKARRIFCTALSRDKGLILNREIWNLINLKANIRDMKNIAGRYYGSYKMWVLSSLFLRGLFLSNSRISEDIKTYLKDFPPEMNNFMFLNDAVLLRHLYARSGLEKEAMDIEHRLQASYGYMTPPLLRAKLDIILKLSLNDLLYFFYSGNIFFRGRNLA